MAKTFWTVRRETRLRQLFESGAEFQAIADALGTTVVSIKGKLRRMGLHRRGTRVIKHIYSPHLGTDARPQLYNSNYGAVLARWSARARDLVAEGADPSAACNQVFQESAGVRVTL